MKSIWRGSLSFGLVSIRVRLYSAVKEHAISFKLLHNKCQEPVAYERWCKHCNKQISWEDVVRGFKLEDGSYFILTQEKIKELKPESTDTIDIIEFAPASQIDTIFLEHHYYLAPEKGSEKAFFLFKSALESAGKVAIGTFVMRDKQYACVINPYEKTMLLTTLNYLYEIKPISQVPELAQLEEQKINAAHLKLALQLIGQLTVKKFNLGQFKDTFVQELKEAIKKGKREKVSPAKRRRPLPSTKKKEKDSLIENLRASLIAPGRSGEVAHARGAKTAKSSRTTRTKKT